MTPEQHARARDIFLDIIAHPPEEHHSLTAKRCGGDAELQREVERLLKHHHEATLQVGPRTPEDSEEGWAVTEVGETGRLSRTTSATSPDEETREGIRLTAGDLVAGRYRVVAWLGGGGMGQVYRVEDLTLHQTVALKFLAPKFAAEQAWRERFMHEARTAREITHPNVCRVFDIGEADEHVFISMEYVDGEDLATLMRRIGPLPQAKVLDMAHQVCGGLAAAHTKGLLHRDLKPANIMLDRRGNIRITDFGLAGAVAELKEGGLIAGTPPYMAPEQFVGIGLSVRTDVYALGLVLYEMLAGRPAFQADDLVEYARLHREEDPPPLSQWVPNVDPALEQIIHHCLQIDPAKRPHSVMTVAAALPGGDALTAAIAADRTPSPETVAAARPRPDALPGPRTLAAITGLLLAALAIARTYAPGPLDMANSKPPEVMAERCRDIIGTVGYNAKSPQHATYGFAGLNMDAPYVSAFSWGDTRSAAQLGGTETLLFWYIQSPRPMTSPASRLEGLQASRLTAHDGTIPGQGAVAVALSPSGRLIYFAATPHMQGAPALKAADAKPVFEEMLAFAELGVESAAAAQPSVQTYLPVDDRRALLFTAADDTAMTRRVDWLAWHGRPILFAVTRQRVAGSAMSELAEEKTRHALKTTMLQVVLVMVALVSFPWAWKNQREDRADRQAAMRFAAFVFAVELIRWLLKERHALDFSFEVASLCEAGLRALSFAAMIWLFYTALEPEARRYWPHLLVAWRRMLSGNLFDPVVGRHIQIGVAVGAFLAVMIVVDRLVVAWLGWDARLPLIDAAIPDRLLGGRFAVAGCLGSLLKALFRALLFLLLLTALRAVVRRPIVSAALAALLIAPMYTPLGSHLAIAWVTIGVGCVGLMVWAMARFGLITVAAALLTAELLTTFPIDLHFDVWYADLTLLALGVVLALAFIGMVGSRSAERSPALGNAFSAYRRGV